ncbi:hypothetical protein [Bacteriophage sp.]|nr:hypothetical protein [Caudoviricetes sp.]UOF80005.1 hypothetical protein [Bacteriophage sp.]
MDYLSAAAQRVAPVASAKLEQAAHALYDACPSVKPAWGQLGDVTKSVWRDQARLKLAGHPRWWSHDPDNLSTLMNAVSAPRIWGALQECIKMELNHEQVAETLDEIAGLFLKLSGSFRPRSGGAKGGSADGAAAKPVRGAKPSKPAAKKTEEADEDLSIDTVREKLKELVEAKGKDKMVEALESVGAGKLADVDESQYQELLDKAQELIDEEDEPAPTKKPAAKKTAKVKAVTLDELTEAAKALIEADKSAFVKLSKKFGKPSECDEDQYADYLKAIQAAMPDDAEEGEDDLL